MTKKEQIEIIFNNHAVKSEAAGRVVLFESYFEDAAHDILQLFIDSSKIEFMPDDEMKKQAEKHNCDLRSMKIMQEILKIANK